MPISAEVLAQMLAETNDYAAPAAQPKHGEEIFAGTDYPRDWSGFIGQDLAKQQLQVQIASAQARGTRLEHILLASGIHGVGKSTLAALTAYQAGVGLVSTTGPLDVDEARKLIAGMSDHDILFIDEAHLLVQGNRTRADWLLPLMTEGKLYGPRGAEDIPNITILAATTDAGKLPATLLSRFMIKPAIAAYSDDEAALIAANLASRMDVLLPGAESASRVARAASGNPRMMRQILTQVRDLGYAYPETHPNLETAFDWAGVSADGLSQIARDVLLLLLAADDHTASIDSLRAQLNEPGPIRHDEQALLQRSYLSVTGRGRKLTELGIIRARHELTQRSAA